ncbi:MAG: hypothetical protein JWQ16_2687 [Novosphingobium sp.]|nr:hypothetical protein [Novosphingobium sp.]
MIGRSERSRGRDPHFGAAQPGHCEIEQHEVWRHGLEGRQALLATLRQQYLEPERAERLRQELPDIGIVIDHQDGLLAKLGLNL